MKKYFKILQVTKTYNFIPPSTYDLFDKIINYNLDMIFDTKEEAIAALEKYADNWANYVIQEIYCNK